MNVISPKARVSHLADIETSVRGSKLVIADGVLIDSFVKIKFVGGSGDIVIGADCAINTGTVLYSGNGITIGKAVLIAANCTLAPTNHQIASRTKRILDQGFMPSRGGILIEDDVWIGANSVILDGAILRRGCVVGAGSIVQGELEPFSINVGNPLRKTGYRGQQPGE